jgi:hypothetical protein
MRLYSAQNLKAATDTNPLRFVMGSNMFNPKNQNLKGIRSTPEVKSPKKTEFDGFMPTPFQGYRPMNQWGDLSGAIMKGGK